MYFRHVPRDRNALADWLTQVARAAKRTLDCTTLCLTCTPFSQPPMPPTDAPTTIALVAPVTTRAAAKRRRLEGAAEEGSTGGQGRGQGGEGGGDREVGGAGVGAGEREEEDLGELGGGAGAATGRGAGGSARGSIGAGGHCRGQWLRRRWRHWGGSARITL